MSQLENKASYKVYFNQIANSNTDIENFLYADDHSVKDKIKDKTGFTLWLEPLEPSNVSSNIDNHQTRRNASLNIVLPVKESSPTHLQLEEHEEQCEEVVQEVISKMLEDSNHHIIHLDINSIKFGPGNFSFLSTQYVGCRLEFSYTQSSHLTINPSKWQ